MAAGADLCITTNHAHENPSQLATCSRQGSVIVERKTRLLRPTHRIGGRDLLNPSSMATATLAQNKLGSQRAAGTF